MAEPRGGLEVRTPPPPPPHWTHNIYILYNNYYHEKASADPPPTYITDHSPYFWSQPPLPAINRSWLATDL